MSAQFPLDFISAPAFRQVGRREYVLRRVCESREAFRPDFYEWLKSNMHVWEAFEREALRVWATGRKHYSSRTLWEVMRHESATKASNDGEWKINNDRAPDVARLFLLLNPDKPAFFETRGRAAA
jgi:hypothetical protein